MCPGLLLRVFRTVLANVTTLNHQATVLISEVQVLRIAIRAPTDEAATEVGVGDGFDVEGD